MFDPLYSNLSGDFIATANTGAKTITLSLYANTTLSSVISTKNFLGASIKRVNTSGVVDTLPLTNISFTSNVLTLSDMTANFASGDLVAVVMIGPDKGFDEINDAQLVTLYTILAGEDLTNGVFGTLRKPVASSTYTPSISMIFGSDVDVSVKTVPGNILSVVATNTNAAVRYFQIHDKASAPVNPNVPLLSLPIPAGTANVPGYLEIGANVLGEGGIWCATGVAYGVSTTNGTFTAASTTDHNEFVTWV